MIYVFEIEIKTVNRNTSESKLVTRTEHAYTLLDACLQANIAQIAETPSCEVTVVKAGPPAEAIRAAASAEREQVAQGVAAIAKAVRDTLANNTVKGR